MESYIVSIADVFANSRPSLTVGRYYYGIAHDKENMKIVNDEKKIAYVPLEECNILGIVTDGDVIHLDEAIKTAKNKLNLAKARLAGAEKKKKAEAKKEEK